VAISRESTAVTATVATGMAPGTYCDILTGGRTGGGASCAGTSVVVDSTGAIQLHLEANSAIAIDAATRM